MLQLNAGLVNKPKTKTVFKSKDLAVLPGPMEILVARPIGQINIGVDFSGIPTILPTSRAASFDVHFFLVQCGYVLSKQSFPDLLHALLDLGP